jgi:hypothetical protein
MARIARVVPAPVPEKALSERGLANADPILTPQATDLYTGGAALLQTWFTVGLHDERHSEVAMVDNRRSLFTWGRG